MNTMDKVEFVAWILAMLLLRFAPESCISLGEKCALAIFTTSVAIAYYAVELYRIRHER